MKIFASNLKDRLNTGGSIEKNAKLGQKGSRDHFYEFWDPSMSQERLKQESQNVARRLIDHEGTNENAKLRQRGSPGVI